MPSPTGIKGLDIILNTQSFPPEEAKNGFRLLLRGAPGTGKTTLGLHLFQHQLNSEIYRDTNTEGLLVYLQEGIESLDKLSKQYQLDFHSHPPHTAKVTFEEYRKNFPFIHSWIKEQNRKHNNNVKICVFIDGISLAKSSFGDSQSMSNFILRLLTELPSEGVFLIIATEDNTLSDDNYFQHLVDCVIDLKIQDNIQRHRFCEIKKCRYIDFFRGLHGFEIFHNQNTKKSTLQIYPNPSCLLFFVKKKGRNAICKERNHKYPSGIQGLEILARGDSDEEFLRLGDSLLITSEPGTDKFSVGLAFLSCFPASNQSSNSDLLWVSFGDSSLERKFNFQTYRSRFGDLVKLYDEEKSKDFFERSFTDIYRPSLTMHPDKVLFQLMSYLFKRKPKCARIIIDGLHNIGREFEDDDQIIDYTISIVRILRYLPIVSIIFIDLPNCFNDLEDVSMKWADDADFIGHLGLKKCDREDISQSFMLTKSRYTNHKTTLSKIKFDKSNCQASLLYKR